MKPIAMKSIMLRFAGVFDLDGLYAAVTDWGKNYGFLWHEVDYKHKVPIPAGAEQEIKWELSKKVTSFIQYKIGMHLHIWDLKEVIVEENGKKKRLSSARIQVTMDGFLVPDWQDIFGGSKFAERLGSWYTGIFIKKDLESTYWDQLYYRMWNLHAVVKKYLEMQNQKYAYKGYLKEN